MRIIGLPPDHFVDHGAVGDLRRYLRIDVPGILEQDSRVDRSGRRGPRCRAEDHRGAHRIGDMPKSGKDTLLGVVIGAAGVFSIAFGVIGLLVGLVVVLAVAALRRSLWVVAGAFVTTGTIWLVLSWRTWTSCEASNLCGDLDLAPFVLACAVLVVIGGAAGGLAWWLGRRRSSPTP